MEQFDDNPLNYCYFMALFAEVAETKIEVPRGAQRDKTDKIYNWRSLRADQALHPAATQ